MPMSDESGRWWIAYNGEAYNFATVREELLGLGHVFRAHTDTEVMLHAWIQSAEPALDLVALGEVTGAIRLGRFGGHDRDLRPPPPPLTADVGARADEDATEPSVESVGVT